MREESDVSIKLLQDEVSISRVIADLGNSNRGNTLMLVGGTHGNELMGIGAIQRVVAYLEEHDLELNGRLLAITGNMEACRLGQRYLYQDLNRMWTRENLDDLHYNRLDLRHTENHELSVVYHHLKEAIDVTTGQFVLIDLHTTSSPTIPFVVTNFFPKSIEFVQPLPLPVIGGLSGFLDGTLLSYVNELGHIGMAYEAGQHQSPLALESHESFIWTMLEHTGILKDSEDARLAYHRQSLAGSSKHISGNFKIISRYRIREHENFRMLPGFENFQPVKKGEELAQNDEGSIHSPYDGYIFMPLYQSRGNDGFFLIAPLNADA